MKPEQVQYCARLLRDRLIGRPLVYARGTVHAAAYKYDPPVTSNTCPVT